MVIVCFSPARMQDDPIEDFMGSFGLPLGPVPGVVPSTAVVGGLLLPMALPSPEGAGPGARGVEPFVVPSAAAVVGTVSSDPGAASFFESPPHEATTMPKHAIPIRRVRRPILFVPSSALAWWYYE